MQTTPDPSVPSGPPRSAPGRLELVRQFVNTADLADGADELDGLDALTAWLRSWSAPAGLISISVPCRAASV